MTQIVLNKTVEDRLQKIANDNWLWISEFLNLYFSNLSEKYFFKIKKNKIEDFVLEWISDEEYKSVEWLSNFKLFKESVSRI